MKVYWADQEHQVFLQVTQVLRRSHLNLSHALYVSVTSSKTTASSACPAVVTHSTQIAWLPGCKRDSDVLTATLTLIWKVKPYAQSSTEPNYILN